MRPAASGWSFMKIRVANEGWGSARAADVQAVVESAARHLLNYCERPRGEEIVVHCRLNEDSPIVFYRKELRGPFTISVTTRGRLWAQLAYQFAHELCHVISGFERLRENPNNWFHEALCELASVFVLIEMSHSWQSKPPYPNWASYADSLWSYAIEVLHRPGHCLPRDATLAEWVQVQEAQLRRDASNRQMNGVVAKALLPLFTEDPKGWNALQFMPSTRGTLPDYLRSWHDEAPASARPFVAIILEALAVDSAFTGTEPKRP